MTTSVLFRRLREGPLEPRVRVPGQPVPPVVEPPRACWGSAPTFINSGGGTRPKHPSTTIEYPEPCPEDEEQEQERVFSPIDFSPTPLRDNECEEPIELEEYFEIFRQFRIQRVRNPDDENLWIDVEEALSSIMRGPDGKMERWIWAQQPPASEIISEGSRGVPGPDITPPGEGEGEGEGDGGGEGGGE